MFQSTDPGFAAQVLSQLLAAKEQDAQQLDQMQQAAIMGNPIMQQLMQPGAGAVAMSPQDAMMAPPVADPSMQGAPVGPDGQPMDPNAMPPDPNAAPPLGPDPSALGAPQVDPNAPPMQDPNAAPPAPAGLDAILNGPPPPGASAAPAAPKGKGHIPPGLAKFEAQNKKAAKKQAAAPAKKKGGAVPPGLAKYMASKKSGGGAGKPFGG